VPNPRENHITDREDTTLPTSRYQGLWESFGQINVRDASTAHLEFSLVDAETGAPVELRKFYFTVFDVDQQRTEDRHREKLCVDTDQYDEYVLREGSSLVVEHQDTRCDGSAGSSVTFLSTRAGFECDNPTDPLKLGTVLCSECEQRGAGAGAAFRHPRGRPAGARSRASRSIFRSTRESIAGVGRCH
jgi:hypothetical protein